MDGTPITPARPPTPGGGTPAVAPRQPGGAAKPPPTPPMQVFKAGQRREARFLKCLIYGTTGTGKTTLGCTAPGPVLHIMSEYNALSVVARMNPDADVVHVTAWGQMDWLYQQLCGPWAGKYRSVVIDSLTDIQDLKRREMVAETAMTIQRWGDLGDYTMEFVRKWRELPVNLIVLCLMIEQGDEGHKMYTPDLYGRASRELPSLLTLVGYTYREMDPTTEEGKAGHLSYKVLFEGQKFVTKTMVGLDVKEVPNLSVWYGKVFGGEQPALVAEPHKAHETPKPAPTPAPTPAPEAAKVPVPHDGAVKTDDAGHVAPEAEAGGGDPKPEAPAQDAAGGPEPTPTPVDVPPVEPAPPATSPEATSQAQAPKGATMKPRAPRRA